MNQLNFTTRSLRKSRGYLSKACRSPKGRKKGTNGSNNQKIGNVAQQTNQDQGTKQEQLVNNKPKNWQPFHNRQIDKGTIQKQAINIKNKEQKFD